MNIYDDKRPIKKIQFPDGNCIYLSTNSNITEIKPYLENGEMAYIVWFAIMKNDVIVQRVNSKYVESIFYE